MTIKLGRYGLIEISDRDIFNGTIRRGVTAAVSPENLDGRFLSPEVMNSVAHVLQENSNIMVVNHDEGLLC